MIILNDIQSIDEFNKIVKNKDIIIYEDIMGSKIYVNYDGNQFVIKPKSLQNDPLNFVDLAIQKYYNEVFAYMSSLPTHVTELLNPNWWFCFEYFPDTQPSHIKYDRKPKNGLILTCIVKGTKYCYNVDELLEYSNLLEIDYLPIIFKGKLSDKQLEAINLYLRTSEKDLEYVFGEKNFSFFIYKLLNPKIDCSFLMDGKFNDNIEKMIIKLIGDETKYTFALFNPMYQKLSIDNDSEYTEMYSFILIKFLEFLQIINLEKYKLKSVIKDKMYLELICRLFNDFMDKIYKNVIQWDLNIPQFFKEDKFKVNLEVLENKKTVDYIKSNEKVEYMFKVILSSFGKTRKKPVGMFTDQTLVFFNKMVTDIDKYINNNLKINREYELQKADLLNFKDYFDLKNAEDSSGSIYPDKGVEELEQGENGKGKFKGKDVSGKPDLNIKKELNL